MKKTLLSLLFATLSTIGFTENVVNGYYITNSKDTIQTKIVISDLFQLHREITVIDTAGKRQTLKPSEIQGFSFMTNNPIDCSQTFDKLNHDNDVLIQRKGFKYTRPTFDLEGEIHSTYYLPDSIWTYESCNLDSNSVLFLRVNSGNGGRLHADQYYSKFDSTTPWYTTLDFLVKDRNIIECNDSNVKEWLISSISDYPLLTSMVNEGKISAFPFDFKYVIDDYNNWSKLNLIDKQDTSLIIKGILDANKYYPTKTPFVLSCVTGTAFFFPGMITAVIIAHSPNEKNIKVPANLSNVDKPQYAKAFKHRAYEKKYKSAAKGALTGGVLCIGLIVLFVAL